MGKVKYSYCLNENNELVHISSVTVENRHSHTFHCLECGNELIAKIIYALKQYAFDGIIKELRMELILLVMRSHIYTSWQNEGSAKSSYLQTFFPLYLNVVFHVWNLKDVSFLTITIALNVK